MKNSNSISSISLSRILLHIKCAIRRPFHWDWHWQGIQRGLSEPSLAFSTIEWRTEHRNLTRSILRRVTSLGFASLAWTNFLLAAALAMNQPLFAQCTQSCPADG